MIKHVVCFKLKDNSKESCEATQKILLSMEGNVPMLRGLSVGIDFLHSERSYDIILEVLLDDRAALDAYQKDPYHCDIVKPYMHSVRRASIAVDCEL